MLGCSRWRVSTSRAREVSRRAAVRGRRDKYIQLSRCYNSSTTGLSLSPPVNKVSLDWRALPIKYAKRLCLFLVGEEDHQMSIWKNCQIPFIKYSHEREATPSELQTFYSLPSHSGISPPPPPPPLLPSHRESFWRRCSIFCLNTNDQYCVKCVSDWL